MSQLGIDEKRGVKTSHYWPPFYVRRKGNWLTLDAQTFEAAKVERDSIESGKSTVNHGNRITLRAAVDHFLEEGEITESSRNKYRADLEEFLNLVKPFAVYKLFDQFRMNTSLTQRFDDPRTNFFTSNGDTRFTL